MANAPDVLTSSGQCTEQAQPEDQFGNGSEPLFFQWSSAKNISCNYYIIIFKNSKEMELEFLSVS